MFMSKVKGSLALIILIISWLAMFWLTGSRTPWQIFSAGDKNADISIYLGDIPSENYDRMGFTKGLVKYIANENAWLAGTDRGELFLFSNDGKQIWKRSLGIGKLVSMSVSMMRALLLLANKVLLEIYMRSILPAVIFCGDFLLQKWSASILENVPIQA